ncbi:MAG: hypothetical protein RID42_16075 [Alphaproteobacteria bacterium]
MKARVYLATTQGPVLVERIARESAPRSAMCLKRTTRVLPVSAGYDAFVRAPSGVIDREFGPFGDGAFRLDVSGEIGDGDSWQLGVFVAHALWARGQLAGPEDPFDAVYWFTGTVDGDLNIGAVAGVASKIDASGALLAECAVHGTKPVFIVPVENAAAIPALDAAVVDVATARAVDDVLRHLGIGSASPGRVPAQNNRSAIRRRWFWAAVGAGLVAAGVLVALLVLRPVQDDAASAPPVAPPPAQPIEVTVVGLFAPAGSTCQAVLFDRVESRRAALSAGPDGTVSMTLGSDLCGFSVNVRTATSLFVLAGLRGRQGGSDRQYPRPPELGGATRFAGAAAWRIDLPVRQARAIDYDMVVLSADTPIAPAALDRAFSGATVEPAVQIQRRRIEGR